MTQVKVRARPCQGQELERSSWPQGTLLWGTARQVAEEELSSVLASVDLTRVQRGGALLRSVRLEDGRLVVPTPGAGGLVGAVFHGTSSDGQPVEVALCGAEPSAQDPSMVWYQIEIWNARKASWENPCIATQQARVPRALVVQGVWDQTGARRDVPGKFTFACENGAIAKCVSWGYKPWEKRRGRSLADMHQACTRMARADYCGDGRSHTHEDTTIDMYDAFGVQVRTTKATRLWKPELASFEAAWGSDGAWCMARTRHGEAVEAIMAQCPGRFEAATQDLGEGDRCPVRRKGGRAEDALLRNRSYDKAGQGPSPAGMTH